MNSAQTQDTNQTKLIALLNNNLAAAIDLKLQAKQAHWNLKGENFISLHELFDKVASEADDYADALAERIVQLGGIAAGTLQAVTDSTTLKTYPKDLQKSSAHVNALGAAIQVVADTARKLIDESDALGDKVTADLCTEIARGLDKMHWFVIAHNNT